MQLQLFYTAIIYKSSEKQYHEESFFNSGYWIMQCGGNGSGQAFLYAVYLK